MRQEFSKATKLAAWQRSGGLCEKCTAKIIGIPEYHHDKECAFDGQPTLENCLVLCRNCHSKITRDRAPVIAKSNRVRNVFLGIKRKSSRPMPGTRASGIRKRMSGAVERW